MRSASNCQKLHRYLLPVALICLVVALVSFSGCITELSRLSGISLPGSGSSTGTANPPAYDTVQAQATQTPATGTAGGSCRQGLTSCAGNCVDITVDIGNCGGCGVVCPTNARCGDSQCYCKDGYDWSAADSACVKNTAPAAEATGSQNEAGGWTCPTDMTACEDNPGERPNCYTLTEDNHCGSCDNACPIDQACMNGQCVPSQTDVNAPTTTICNSDSDCKVTSEQKLLLQQEHEKMICVQGNCVPACISGYSNCDGDLQNGCEAYLLTDTSNCGACGTTCTGGKSCINGGCVCPTGQFVYKGVCVIRTYIDPSIRNEMCISPLSPCNGDCVNLQTSAINCGTCGTTCPINGWCSSGECVCPVGYVIRNEACIQLTPVVNKPIEVLPIIGNPILRKISL